jgi:neutral ceramidase
LTFLFFGLEYYLIHKVTKVATWTSSMGDFADRISEILEGYCRDRGVTLLCEFNGNHAPTFDQEIILTLQRVVREGGTLVVPTCTHQQEVPSATFNLKLSPSEMGSFSEQFRLMAGVIRSNNPTHSVAAWGKDAEQLTAGHRYAYGRQTQWGESPFGIDSPWDRLMERDAVCIILNPDWSNSPLPGYSAALFAARYENISRQMPFFTFSTAWLENHFNQSSEARVYQVEDHVLLIFPMRWAVAGLVQALDTTPEACVEESEFHQWVQTRRWLETHGYLKAGAAKVVITPSVPFLRWEGKQMTGVFRDLFARTIVLQSGQQTAVLVLCDLIGVTQDIVTAVRQAVQQRLPGNPMDIMVACTHAHPTPDTIAAGFWSKDYLAYLVEQITASVLQAASQLQPVRLGWSKTPVRGIAHSRRVRMKNGKVYTTRYGVPSTWRVSPSLIVGKGEIDPEMTVIRIERLNGSVLAAVSNFGVHPSIALASSLASGDFPGEAMHILENALGPDVVVLCTTGAAGDVDPTLEMPYWGPRNEQSAIHVGRIFAAQVMEALERTQVSDFYELQVVSTQTCLPVRADWLALFGDEIDIIRAEFSRDGIVSDWLRQILETGECRSEIQSIRINGLTLLSFPGEVFASTGLALKKASPDPLMILETTNDYLGYISPQQAFEEGGYESGQHFASRLYPEAESVLRNAALQLLKPKSV